MPEEGVVSAQAGAGEHPTGGAISCHTSERRAPSWTATESTALNIQKSSATAKQSVERNKRNGFRGSKSRGDESQGLVPVDGCDVLHHDSLVASEEGCVMVAQTKEGNQEEFRMQDGVLAQSQASASDEPKTHGGDVVHGDSSLPGEVSAHFEDGAQDTALGQDGGLAKGRHSFVEGGSPFHEVGSADAGCALNVENPHSVEEQKVETSSACQEEGALHSAVYAMDAEKAGSYSMSLKNEQTAQAPNQRLSAAGRIPAKAANDGKRCASPFEVIPRTSAGNGCDGPRRGNGLSCRYLHDYVGGTCRREPGGPVPDRWDKFSDFHDVVDLKQLADKYQYRWKETERPSTVNGGTSVQEDSKVNSTAGSDTGREDVRATPVEVSQSLEEPFEVPNMMMVERLLLIPSKTFLDPCFNHALQNCRPFGPSSLQSRFEGDRRRRFARQQKRKAAEEGESVGDKQEKVSDTQDDVSTVVELSTVQNKGDNEVSSCSVESKVAGSVTRAPAENINSLIGEGRARLLSVVNLCMTERHYEMQAPRRDGVSVFFHKITGGGESVPPESVRSFFRLLSLLTRQGAKAAERWATTKECANCRADWANGLVAKTNGEKNHTGSDDGSTCSCDFRFVVWVHCTHGINRTGLVVSALLMALLKLSAEEALDAFARARGHRVNRPEVIAALKDFQEKGLPEGFVHALNSPQLCRVFAKNAIAEGVDLDKGSCVITVKEGGDDASEVLIPSIQPPPALLKAIQELRQSMMQRVAPLNSSSSTEKNPKVSISPELSVVSGPETASSSAAANALDSKEITRAQLVPKVIAQAADLGVSEARAENDGGRTDCADAVGKEVPCVSGQGHAEDGLRLTLSEEETDCLLPVPEEVPNDGIVLYGPIANDLVSPEEMILHILQLDERIQICDVRVLQTEDFNSALIYPQCVVKKNLLKKRKRGTKISVDDQSETKLRQHPDLPPAREITNESVPQQSEDSKVVDIRVAGDKVPCETTTSHGMTNLDSVNKEKSDKLGGKEYAGGRLEFHYILYVQVADSVSFDILLSADVASLRHQDLQAFPSNYLPYLIKIGLERDSNALRYSKSGFSHGDESHRGARKKGSVRGSLAPPVGLPPSVGASAGPVGRRRFPGLVPLVSPPPRFVPSPPPPLPPVGCVRMPAPPLEHQRPPPFDVPPPAWGRRGPPAPFGCRGGAPQGPVPPPPLPSLPVIPPGGGFPHMMEGPRPWVMPPGEQFGFPPPPGAGGAARGSLLLPQHRNGAGPAVRGAGESRLDPSGSGNAWQQGRPGWSDWNGSPRCEPKPQWQVASGLPARQVVHDKGGRWGIGNQRLGDVGTSVDQAESSGRGISALGSWRVQRGGPCGGEERRWGDGPTSFPGGRASFTQAEDVRSLPMGFSHQAGRGSCPPPDFPAHAQHHPTEYGTSNPSYGHQPNAFGRGMPAVASVQNIGAQGTVVNDYQQHDMGYAYSHRPEPSNQGEADQSQTSGIPPYVLQLLQQQAALRGSNVEPHVLAQLYQQYYQSFLSSMSQLTGGQQLTQEQLLQYLQRMQS